MCDGSVYNNKKQIQRYLQRCLQDGFKEEKTKREGAGNKISSPEIFVFSSFHGQFLGWCRCYRREGCFTRRCEKGCLRLWGTPIRAAGGRWAPRPHGLFPFLLLRGASTCARRDSRALIIISVQRSIGSVCPGCAASVRPPAPALKRLYQLLQGQQGVAARDTIVQHVWVAQTSRKGWPRPAELLIFKDFCHHTFGRAGFPSSSFLQQAGGCARNIFFILPPSLFQKVFTL